MAEVGGGGGSRLVGRGALFFFCTGNFEGFNCEGVGRVWFDFFFFLLLSIEWDGGRFIFGYIEGF